MSKTRFTPEPWELDEARANAHLSAAAQEMYDYIKRTADWLDLRVLQCARDVETYRGRFDSLAKATEFDGRNYAVQLKEARAILAKAEGKEG